MRKLSLNGIADIKKKVARNERLQSEIDLKCFY